MRSTGWARRARSRGFAKEAEDEVNEEEIEAVAIPKAKELDEKLT